MVTVALVGRQLVRRRQSVHTELPGNISVGIAPDPASRKMLQSVQDFFLRPILVWCDAALDLDALVRISNLRSDLRENIGVFCECSSALSCEFTGQVLCQYPRADLGS